MGMDINVYKTAADDAQMHEIKRLVGQVESLERELAERDACAQKLRELHRSSIEDEEIPPDAMGYDAFCELCECVEGESFEETVAVAGANGYSGDPLDPEVLEACARYHETASLLARFVADEDGCGSGLIAALHLIRRNNESSDDDIRVGVMVDGEFVELNGDDLVGEADSVLDPRIVAEKKHAASE